MTWHIQLRGQVQGVGFRPYVYQLARQFQLTGWVNNTNDGVHIEFNTSADTAQAFYQHLLKSPPPLARITAQQLSQVPEKFFDNFQIIRSTNSEEAKVLPSPDFGICQECLTEQQSPDNRRYLYPFITCTNCGPRYSIYQQLPYDRTTTSMKEFSLCSVCQQEYENPEDRRYHAQTNSCPACSIQLSCYQADGTLISQENPKILREILTAWRAGKIVAIKGIGGYLLTCDARQAKAVITLRERKHRPGKPLAVMFPNLAAIEQQVGPLSEQQKHLLTGSVAPITLVRMTRPSTTQSLTIQEIAPGLTELGVLLPYAPIFTWLFHHWSHPIIATSGNHSQVPLAYQESAAPKTLGSLADIIVSHNRPITVPQDDSLVRFTPFYHRRIILRRARGLAPSNLLVSFPHVKKTILAIGADLKSSFGVLHQSQPYLSQYLGDQRHYDNQVRYQLVLDQLLQLLQTEPKELISDLHPDYASTHLAQGFAQERQIPWRQIQHHIAHFYAILGEHQLLAHSDPILGVIWDGMGLGTDQQIWGGEFLLYESSSIRRITHFDYFPSILRDKMAKEPRIAALALSINTPEIQPLLKEKFSPTERAWYQKILQQSPKLYTSSVGRIFDAVASLLGLKDQQQYAGEAAILLEQLATSYLLKQGIDGVQPYPLSVQGLDIPTAELIRQVANDIQAQQATGRIAARFHRTLVHLIDQVATHLKVKAIACSGGVFQNALLTDLCQHFLQDRFQLFFHRDLAPNDENIAFGQLVAGAVASSSLV